MQFLTQVATAFSDPIRIQMLEILMEGRDASCVSSPHPQFPRAMCPYLDLQPKLGDISKSKLSYHLKELRVAGLVEEHRLGKQVFSTVNKKTITQFLEDVTIRFLAS